jgi:hypothetical protein
MGFGQSGLAAIACCQMGYGRAAFDVAPVEAVVKKITAL